jgi:hypothetical protein
MNKPASILCAVILLVGATIAEAQQTGKIFLIGFLDPSNASGSAVLVDAFREELTKLGWIDGKNITIEYRFAEGKGDERVKIRKEPFHSYPPHSCGRLLIPDWV